MVLSQEDYLKLLGITGLEPGPALQKQLLDMMLRSLGDSMVQQEVELLGTVETQDLLLQVSIKEQEVTI